MAYAPFSANNDAQVGPGQSAIHRKTVGLGKPETDNRLLRKSRSCLAMPHRYRLQRGEPIQRLEALFPAIA